MENQFIPYEQALELKKLGFDKPCLGWFRSTLIPSNFTEFFLETEFGMNEGPSDWVNSNLLGNACSAPLWQQAFDWFRDKYNLNTLIIDSKSYNWYFNINDTVKDDVISEVLYFDTYQEARQACLEKLIEIIKNNV